MLEEASLFLLRAEGTSGGGGDQLAETVSKSIPCLYVPREQNAFFKKIFGTGFLYVTIPVLEFIL